MVVSVVQYFILSTVPSIVSLVLELHCKCRIHLHTIEIQVLMHFLLPLLNMQVLPSSGCDKHCHNLLTSYFFPKQKSFSKSFSGFTSTHKQVKEWVKTGRFLFVISTLSVCYFDLIILLLKILVLQFGVCVKTLTSYSVQTFRYIIVQSVNFIMSFQNEVTIQSNISDLPSFLCTPLAMERICNLNNCDLGLPLLVLFWCK